MDAQDVKDAARQTNDHPVIRAAARIGYAANGVMHLLIAWLAWRLAMTTDSVAVDQSGALAVLDTSLGGPVALWILTVGFAGLSVWQGSEAVSGVHGDGARALTGRAKAVAKAVVYATLAWSTASVARGVATASSSQTVDATHTALTLPGGRAVVVIAGLVVIAVGAYHVAKGATRRFRRDLVQDPGTAAVAAGVVGYVAKGVAFVVAGGLVLLAGTTGRSAEAKGLSGAMTWLEHLPSGPWILAAVALGIACYGVYSFFRARYTRV